MVSGIVILFNIRIISIKCSCSLFDTDSLKIGATHYALSLHHPAKNVFKTWNEVEGPTVTGVAGGIIAKP